MVRWWRSSCAPRDWLPSSRRWCDSLSQLARWSKNTTASPSSMNSRFRAGRFRISWPFPLAVTSRFASTFTILRSTPSRSPDNDSGRCCPPGPAHRKFGTFCGRMAWSAMPFTHDLRTNLQFRPINWLVHYSHRLRCERFKYVLNVETLAYGPVRGSSRGIDQTRAVYSPRRLRFSLSHLTLLHHSPPAFIELAAQAGYDFVGLRVIPLNLPGEPIHPLVSDARLRRQTKIALRNTGVGVLDVELARILPDNDVSRYLPALECAAELGARHVLSSAWCSDRSFVQDQFCALCELVRPLGLTVDFEFVTFAAYATLQHAV